MSEFKIGDKIYIEGEIAGIDNYSQHNCSVRLKSGEHCHLKISDVEMINSTSEILKKTYESGLNDAWELVNKVINSKLTFGDCKKYFGLDINYKGAYDLTKALFEMGYEELKTRFDAYENKTKIKVGDVVFNTVNNQYAVVLQVNIDRGSAMVVEKFRDKLQIHTPDLKALKETNKKVDIVGILTEIGKE